ncbi:MAG: ABC transporter, partial [Acidovorax sp.]|nr:ABC transporter [Acidovorax sp.]
MARTTNAQERPQDMRHLMRELAPFLRPYRIHLAGAMAFLLLAALATLAFPTALRQLIDGAISAATPGGKGVGAPA